MHQPFIRQWGASFSEDKLTLIKYPIAYNKLVLIAITHVTNTVPDVKTISIYNKNLNNFYRQQLNEIGLGIEWFSIGV